jgi:hypothetical protein
MNGSAEIWHTTQQVHENGVCDCETVTITIRRDDAENFLRKSDPSRCTWANCTNPQCIVERAFQAALGER